MRWSEDRISARPLPIRWTAALVAAAAVGFALVGGLTVTAPAGSQRPDDGASLTTDPVTEPTGRGGLPHAVATPTSAVPEAPVVPPAPRPAPSGTTAATPPPTPAPVPAPVAVPAADPVDSPGKPCAAEGSVAVTAADRPLVCIAGGSGQLRWRFS